MSELKLHDRLVTLPRGAQVGDKPEVRLIVTATRLLVSPMNADADDLLPEGEITLPVDVLRELLL